jgi:hypothetical protein
MSPVNPYLQQLGFQADDRVVVMHADDIGMCHATLPAIDELMAFGLVTSASVMVPCPWFLEAASWHRRNAHFDLGIHLTLTSEWPRYRWGPVSCRDEASGLLDDQGFLHSNTADVRRHAKGEAVRAERRRQIDAVVRSGIDPSHMDNHMMVAMCDEFLEIYRQAWPVREGPLLHCPCPDDYDSLSMKTRWLCIWATIYYRLDFLFCGIKHPVTCTRGVNRRICLPIRLASRRHASGCGAMRQPDA